MFLVTLNVTSLDSPGASTTSSCATPSSFIFRTSVLLPCVLPLLATRTVMLTRVPDCVGVVVARMSDMEKVAADTGEVEEPPDDVDKDGVEADGDEEAGAVGAGVAGVDGVAAGGLVEGA